jgi:hypothetical protein
VAISHVWADGLGNAFENGLPACQLRMLQTYLAQISRDQSSWSAITTFTTSTLFWMDTLCIPVQVAPPGIPFSNEDLYDIKGKAIDKMNMVYSSSSHTLVLDAEMRTIPMAADHATKLAYSQCCGWTTRSWTLQEGCLPPLTVYALADGIYSQEAERFRKQFDLGKVNFAIRFAFILMGKRLTTPSLVMASRGLTPKTVARCFNFSVHRDIWTLFSTRYFSIWDAYHPVMAISRRKHALMRNRYTGVWNELLDRASSQPADTLAIFANLLGVSAYEVLKRETEQERIALIIRQQKVLPVEILFNTGQRLQERLHEQNTRSAVMSQSPEHLVVLENTLEESIGLLNMSEPQTPTFKNGWVPATIGGDRFSQPHIGGRCLLVLDHCLQIHEDDKEQYACMYTTTGAHIPRSTFVLDFECQTEDKELTACTKDMFIAIDRVINSSMQSAQEEPEETVLGHCFMYDPSSLLAMSIGLTDYAPGAHLVILSRSEGRLTTRYSGPIRLSRITKKKQSLDVLPVVECDCNVHDSKDFVDILYGQSLSFVVPIHILNKLELTHHIDAEDLGPLLTTSAKSPGQMFLEHWLNPFSIFTMHGLISGALKPYVGTLRPRVVKVTLFIMPLVVYLYQRIIMEGAAKRLFLEPLNDRGQLDRSSRSWTRRSRRRIDAAIVASWSVILVGPVIDVIFWLILKGSEGRHATYSKSKLLIAVTYMSYWYLFIGTVGTNGRGAKMAKWYYFVVVMLLFAGALHDLITLGLRRQVMLDYFSLFLNLFFFTWTIKVLRRDKRR